MTPEEITTLFATAAASFQTFVGQPTDDDLTALRDVIYPLLLDIPYDEQQGGHNLIGLVEPTALYQARWANPFPIPIRPPAYPAIADDATPVVRARREAEHAILTRDYTSYEAAERAVAKFIRDAVDEVWYRDLRHPRSYYVTVTAKQLIDHLDANCGGLHPSDLVRLPTDMMTYYTEADGIPEYINMLEEAQRKSSRANLPIADDNLMAIASTAILASGHFPRPTDEWEALPLALRTWTAWKTHYRAAHLARKRQLLAAGHAPGGAHAVTGTEYDPTTIPQDTYDKLDGYLNNIAAAATNDGKLLERMVESNTCLASYVTSLTASVASLTAAYTLLANKITPEATQRPQKMQQKRPERVKAAANGYCWTHGFRVREGHTSATCTGKAEGHKNTATRANTMGGSNANKGWDT